MTLQYTITEEDYLEYNLYHFAHSKSQQRTLLIFRCIVPFLFVLVFMIQKPEYPIYALVIYVTISTGWIAFMPRLIRRSIRKQVSKQVGEGRRNEFLGAYTFSLADRGIVETGPGRVTEISYENVERIGEDSCHLYIYIGMISAYIIPLSAFRGEGQKQEFLELLRQRCSNLV